MAASNIFLHHFWEDPTLWYTCENLDVCRVIAHFTEGVKAQRPKNDTVCGSVIPNDHFFNFQSMSFFLIPLVFLPAETAWLAKVRWGLQVDEQILQGQAGIGRKRCSGEACAVTKCASKPWRRSQGPQRRNWLALRMRIMRALSIPMNWRSFHERSCGVPSSFFRTLPTFCFWQTSISLESMRSSKQTRPYLSVKYWLFHRHLYNGLVWSPHNWVGFHPLYLLPTTRVFVHFSCQFSRGSINKPVPNPAHLQYPFASGLSFSRVRTLKRFLKMEPDNEQGPLNYLLLGTLNNANVW